MDLHSGLPYWPLMHGIMSSYPSLSKDLSTEIVVIGGGITGAIIAWDLSEAGHEVVLLDRRHIGMGSTAASTALLQYELDTGLCTLIKRMGEKAANEVYLLCEKAVHEIGILCRHTGSSSLYNKSSSFQFASFQKHTDGLKEEWQCRKKAGLDVEWLDKSEVIRRYGFSKPGGILSATGAGLDAYALTHQLMRKACKKGLLVYDHTEVNKIEYHQRGVSLYTTTSKKIKARKVIITCGYESEQFLPVKVQQLNSTYAIISEPLQTTNEFWYKNSMIWETATPYLYLRTTHDNRILIGGKDTQGSDPGKRFMLLPQKAKQLEKTFRKLFPHIPFITDFSWAGSFASTRDGLPYIGCANQCPHGFFVLGMGGNGIVFSMIAKDIVRDWLHKKANKNAAYFSFNRT